LKAQEAEPAKKSKPAPPGLVEVRFHDDSVMKLQIKEEKIEIATQFGVLMVPTNVIQKLELSQRVPEEIARKIDAAILDLNMDDGKKREAAMEYLLEQKVRSVPALQAAARNPNRENAKHAQVLLQKLQEILGEDGMNIRTTDAIHTEESKIVGRIPHAVLRVYSEPFGELTLKLAYVRSFRAVGVEEPQSVNVQPDPGNLSNFRHLIGQTLHFRVTAVPQGSLWGTDVHTSDSNLASAAIHCGVLRPGQTGVVKVQILQPPAGFQGSTRNGITSSDYGSYGGAYRILK
jgi:hypothetical protein